MGVDVENVSQKMVVEEVVVEGGEVSGDNANEVEILSG